MNWFDAWQARRLERKIWRKMLQISTTREQLENYKCAECDGNCDVCENYYCCEDCD